MALRRRREGAVSLLAIVAVIIVLLAILGLALLVPFRSVSVFEAREVPATAGVEGLRFDLDCDVGDVRVRFVESGDPLVNFTVKGEAKQGLLASGDPISLTWGQEVQDGILLLSAKVDVEAFGTTFPGAGLVTELTIFKGLATALDVKCSVGNIEMSAPKGARLTQASLVQTTGDVRALIGSGTVLEGDFLLQTTTGASELIWQDVEVVGDVQVTVRTTTGGVRMAVDQGAGARGNASFQGATTTGGVELELDIEGANSARVASGTSIGNVNVVRQMGFSGTPELMSSSNYPTDSKLGFELSAITGGIELDLTYT